MRCARRTDCEALAPKKLRRKGLIAFSFSAASADELGSFASSGLEGNGIDSANNV